MTSSLTRRRKPSSDVDASISPYFSRLLSADIKDESEKSKDHVTLSRRLRIRSTKPKQEHSMSDSSEEFYENKVISRRKRTNTRRKRSATIKVMDAPTNKKHKLVVLRDRLNYAVESENVLSDESSGDLFLDTYSPVSGFSKTKNKKNKKSALTESLKERVSDSYDSTDWEEVADKKVEEIEFMEKLLNETAASERTGLKSPKKDITISVPFSYSNRSKCARDPKRAAELEKINKIRNLYSSMHFVHLMCYLAHTRFMNRLCDSVIYRAIGLSLLSDIPSLLDKSKQFLLLNKWTVKHLQACVTAFRSYAADEHHDHSQKSFRTILSRLNEGKLTMNDCILLLVASLRALSFDVRLVLALRPMPLKPTNNQLKDFLYSTSKSSESLTMKLSKKELVNRKIISSSDEDIPGETPANVRPAEILILAEVFLPCIDSWVTANVHSSSVSDDSNDIILPEFLYVVGVTTCVAKDPSVAPYVGRSPVDLSARYDPDWCLDSRRHRISSDKWNFLLTQQRLFFDRDALASLSIVSRTEDLPNVKRDCADEDKIRTILLKKPFPSRLHDYKNHPLYALKRNLLKFEVIYPPDATPLGFFRQEPIYLKECVHLCHTRESWLKEAKVVRLRETPAKVVKARLTLKRKLLQASGEPPPTVDVFGVWQVDDYVPPVAQNGVVPRNEHGNVELFKPCMLPIGCVHICLSGIHHIAKELGIDCAPAMVGWEFHGAGWAHPRMNGFVVCREAVPALVDAWHTKRMDAAKAAAADRSERALENWRRLVRGLFLWHRVKAQFALNPLHQAVAGEVPLGGRQTVSAPKSKAPTRLRANSTQRPGPLSVPKISIADASAPEDLMELTGLPTFPHQKAGAPSKAASKRRVTAVVRQAKRAGGPAVRGKAVRRKRRRRKGEETTSEEEESPGEEFGSSGED